MSELSPTLYLYFSFLALFFGACVGSFLNVCIYRIPREESIVTPRSHCPHCGKAIAWYDNIPVISFLLLRARCRHCKGEISPRYFWVELMTAFLFLMIWNKYGVDIRAPVYWLMAAGLILGTFVDFEHMIIPDRVTLGGIVAGFILSLVFPALHNKTNLVDSAAASLIGIGVGAGLLWLVGYFGKKLFKKDAMGLGDVKLLGAIGAFLGWQAVLFIVMISSLIGSLVGIVLILLRRKEWQSRIPYGPYISISAIVWILWGVGLWQAYVRWVGGGSFL